MKKVLVMSNMYPSQKYPHYGIFVKRTNELIEELDFKITTVYVTKSENIFFKITKYLLFFIRSCYHLIFLNYEYIYIHFPSITGIPLRVLKKLLKKKNIITNIHGNDLIPENKKDMRNLINTKNCIELSKVVIVPSEYFKSKLEEKYPSVVKNKKLRIFPSAGINLNEFISLDKDRCREELGMPMDFQLIGMVSRIEIDKGWDDFINAAQSILTNSKKVKFVIVGGGTQYSQLESLLKQHEIEEYFILFPFMNHENIVKLINSLDVFCIPTKRRSESLGLIGIEALATGAIVVGPDKYGPVSYLKNEYNSLVFKSGDSISLAEVLEIALELEEEKKGELQKNARKTAEIYDEKKQIEILKKILEEEMD